MEIGSHDYRDSLPVEGIKELTGFVAAIARDNVPTLAEVMAAKPLILTGQGALIPEVFPAVSGEPGEDRDSAQAAELARLVKHMDDAVKAWDESSLTYPDQDDLLSVIIDLTETWQAIRKITQSNQPGAQGA